MAVHTCSKHTLYCCRFQARPAHNCDYSYNAQMATTARCLLLMQAATLYTSVCLDSHWGFVHNLFLVSRPKRANSGGLLSGRA